MSRRQLPRTTAAILDAATFLPGEIAVDTTNDELRYDGDGSTVGGIKVARKDGVGTSVTSTGSTTARTLAARFADVGNVKDFGAVGDGSTDDTAAIEAALAVWDSIYLPKGVYMLGSRLDVPAGKKIYGAGFDDTILRASATGYNGMTVGNNCVLVDFCIDGNSKGGSYSGILYDGVYGCYTTQVSTINWGADGIAITNAAHHNTFGELHSTNNGSRGIIIDPNCYSNQIGSVDTRGSTNSGLLIGHNSYRNQIGLLICGGHQNSALWIHNAAYENQVDSVIVEAPATGYENNSAILFGWGALRNTIGQAIVTGWRRGVQFKGDDADATYTDADTKYNHIGALYVTTDNGTSAAGVYLDANNGYFAKYNSIGKLHVKSATYGIWDASGTNGPNDWPFQSATFESVTTPFSIVEDIASATTTTLANLSGEYGRVTGTTTITSFGAGSFGLRKTLRFAAALTLTHNGTSLILPGGANITTAANDTIDVVCLGGSNWLCVGFKTASALLLSAALATAAQAKDTTDATHALTPQNLKDIGAMRLLWVLTGANFNSTSDQAFTKVGTFTNWILGPNGCIRVVNPSGAATSAVGGIYSAAAKGGDQILSSAQAWTALTTNQGQSVSGTANGLALRSDSALYLSLSTPHGSAVTADVYIFGIPLT